MNRVLWIAAGAVAALISIVLAFAYIQASSERVDFVSDLQYRTRVVADSLEEAITPSVRSQATSTVQKVISRIANNERIAGIAVFNSSGEIVAIDKQVPDTADVASMIATAMDSAKPSGAMVDENKGTLYIYVTPLYDGQSSVIGALAVAQNASYIDESIGDIWWRNVQRILALSLLMLATIFGLVYWAFRRPIQNLSESLRAIRRGEAPEDLLAADGFLAPLAHEIAKVTTSLHQARQSASHEARMRMEQLDSPWTADRLREFMRAYLKERPIFVVSNRGSHTPQKIKDKIAYMPVAGGMTTALLPVLEASRGTWIAVGHEGQMDPRAVDGKIKMPPDEPAYTFKQVPLGDEDARRHYNFSAEALYPLCLITHVRPAFRQDDWAGYRKVNGMFAAEILREVAHIPQPIILINDYHFALLPAMIKKSRPDARVGLFWHVPWPNEESFSICPWRKEILAGMLGADVIGFNTQQFCNYFMDTVSTELESIVDWDRASVVRGAHRTHIKPFPVSIAFTNSATVTTNHVSALPRSLEIPTKYMGLGVDRLDYTKGIPERFRAIEALLEAHPRYREHFTFVQIASPHRQHIQKYSEYKATVLQEAERINARFGTKKWKPIILKIEQYTHAELTPLYRRADVCVVTSLHDSMNLVAKEYVAARDDGEGALVVSKFAGASRELKGAFVVNPYSAEETGEAIHAALSLSRVEKRTRMRLMRDIVKNYNVYRWAAEYIKAVVDLD